MGVTHRLRWIIAACSCVCFHGSVAQAQRKAAGREPSAQQTPSTATGIIIHDALVEDCLSLQDAGDSPRAISRLSDAVKNSGGQPLDRLNARRLGLGLVLLRAGEARASQRVLHPLASLKQACTLKRQAQVLADIAAQQVRGNAEQTEAMSDETWRHALAAMTDELCDKVESCHAKVRQAIDQSLWPNVAPLVADAQEHIDRLGVIATDACRQRHVALRIAHARHLAAAVRQTNVAIAALLQQSSNLAGQMSMRSDSNTGKRGYTPAEVVAPYNQIVERILQANAMGEGLLEAYVRAVESLDGRLKRDATVKLSKTSLPGKRVVFGR